METIFKPLIKVYKCPYCGELFGNNDSAESHRGLCSTASLISEHFNESIGDLPIHKFNEWNIEDKFKFCKKLESFFDKYYR